MSLEAGVALAALVIASIVSLTWFLQHRRAARQAEQLLQVLLTPREIDSLRAHGYVEVPSRLTPERVYRVPAEPGLVEVIDWGTRTAWLCARPLRSIPAAEELLVHKLMLEGAEGEYWQQANHFTGFAFAWRSGEDQVAVWTSRGPGVLGQRWPASAPHPTDAPRRPG
jgi:hypothetical protein